LIDDNLAKYKVTTKLAKKQTSTKFYKNHVEVVIFIAKIISVFLKIERYNNKKQQETQRT